MLDIAADANMRGLFDTPMESHWGRTTKSAKHSLPTAAWSSQQRFVIIFKGGILFLQLQYRIGFRSQPFECPEA
jgi:hypothetical protein